MQENFCEKKMEIVSTPKNKVNKLFNGHINQLNFLSEIVASLSMWVVYCTNEQGGNEIILQKKVSL